MNINKHFIKHKKTSLTSAILCAMGSAQAATIQIQGGCTLVDAIQAANTDLPVGTCGAGSGSDVIQVVTPDSNITISTIFSPGVNGPGDNGLPAITSDITLEGNGATIRANNGVDAFRLFEVDSSGVFTLRDTTVSGADNGIGVGSGLYSYGGTVNIENSTFELNNGAITIYGSYGNSITNSSIRHNFSNIPNAAGLNVSFAELDINNSSIVENRNNYFELLGGTSLSGGALIYQSTVNITNTTISGNQGAYAAALAIDSAPPPPLPLARDRFANSPMRGVIAADVTITNSTITNNRANIASGVVQYGSYGSLTLQGNIIAGNKVSLFGYGENLFTFNPPGLTLDANNIIGDATGTGSNVPLGASDSSFSNYADDNLYPLTLTNGQLVHPLKVGSAAIDGNDLSCFGSLFDQEGKGRGLDGDGNGSFFCDVGSFEHSLPIMADDAPCTLENAIVSANGDVGAGGCQVGNGHDIIMLPENSIQSQDSILGVNPTYATSYFGLPNIVTGITIEGNGSTIQRDASATDPLDLLLATEDGQLNLVNTTVTAANGIFGAITAWYGHLNLIDSTVTNNQNNGVFIGFSNNSSVSGTAISQNTANPYGVTYGFGHLAGLNITGFNLNSSSITGNSNYTVGGLDLRQSTRATIENTTISSNTGYLLGGAIIAATSNQGTVMKNSTVTNNEGTVFAGGMYVLAYTPDALQFRESIISGNVFTPPAPGIEVNSNVLGGNAVINGGTPPIEIFSASPYLVLDGNNIIGQNGESGTYGATLGLSDYLLPGATSTVIGPLADNGGGTLSHSPTAGGPAVDALSGGCGLREDQLGRIRPWDGDGDGTLACDIGSVEFGSVTSSDLIFEDGFEATIVVRRSLPNR